MSQNDEWFCPGCKRTFHKFLDDMRQRAGQFTIEDDGERKDVDHLCEDCHRDLIRG